MERGLTFEVRRVCHGIRTSSKAPRICICRASIISTEGDVHNQRMVMEMRFHVARIGREESSRRTPFRRVRFLCGDVCGNGIPEETPYNNSVLVPQVNEYASLIVVEIFPVASTISVEKCAASIGARRARTCSADQSG